VIPAAALVLVVTACWTWWAERHPQRERALRILVQERLEQGFPEYMEPVAGRYGLFSRLPESGPADAPRAVLVHGLDEPGGIWNDLVSALQKAGVDLWEFHYPNDQAIARSAGLLADEWPLLDPGRPVVLIGHSMGGLVVRDFVARLRHPVGGDPLVRGSGVAGAILVGTPNQGSEWARLRVWLELRELFSAEADRRFSLFASLRDGTGAAKIDLRPGSGYLDELNGLSWPPHVPVRIIGGTLADPPPALQESLRAIRGNLVSEELGQAFQAWWSDLGTDLGDGVVPVASLTFPGAPPPILVSASHRGLLVRRSGADQEPPAIRPIIEFMTDLRAGDRTTPRTPPAGTAASAGSQRTVRP